MAGTLSGVLELAQKAWKEARAARQVAIRAQSLLLDGVQTNNFAEAAPPAWAGSTVYADGVFVTKSGNVYRAIYGGTSGATGPTGFGVSNDNGIIWGWWSAAQTWATQGARLSSFGSAAKVAPGNLQVGRINLDQIWANNWSIIPLRAKWSSNAFQNATGPYSAVGLASFGGIYGTTKQIFFDLAYIDKSIPAAPTFIAVPNLRDNANTSFYLVKFISMARNDGSGLYRLWFALYDPVTVALLDANAATAGNGFEIDVIVAAFPGASVFMFPV